MTLFEKLGLTQEVERTHKLVDDGQRAIDTN